MVKAINLDENLLKRAISIFKGKTGTEVVSLALLELIERHEQKDLYDLFDSGDEFISDDYDYKALRGGGLNDFS